jgi:ABC-2 type transport system permease protein
MSTPAPAASNSPSRRRAYGLLVLTELRLALRYPVGLVFGLGLPMLLLIIFGSIPSLTQPKKEFGGVSFFTVYAPTLMVLVLLVLGLLSLPTQMAGYREQGVLRRMSTTPVPASALLGAQLAVNLILAAASIVMLLGVGAGAFNLVLPSQAGWYLLSLVLTIAAMFGIGLCVAALASSPQVASAIGMGLFYPLAFFAGLYFPLVELHSSVIDQIAKVLPSGAGFDALHASLAGRFPGGRRSECSSPTRSCSVRSPSAGSGGASRDPRRDAWQFPRFSCTASSNPQAPDSRNSRSSCTSACR